MTFAPNTSAVAEEKTAESKETPSQVVTEMYKQAAERYRGALKWIVGSVAVVPAALVGTAPFSGLADIVRRNGVWAAPANGFLVTVAAVIGVVFMVAWIMRPVEMSLPELAKDGCGVYAWRRHFQNQCKDDPDVYLSGLASNLAIFSSYRGAWLGTVSDIERALASESSDDRAKRLHGYLKAAKARRDADGPTVSTVLQRGALANLRGKARLASLTIGTLSLIAAGGFVIYLGGLPPSGPPIIESVTASSSAPKAGDTVTLQVIATGTGFTYDWKHDGDSLPNGNAPKFLITSFDATHEGTYSVVVTDKDGHHAYSDPIRVSPAEE